MKQNEVVFLGPCPPPYGGVANYLSKLFQLLPHRDRITWLACGNFQETNANIRKIKDTGAGTIKNLLPFPSRTKIFDSSTFFMEYPKILLIPSWIIVKIIKRLAWIKILHDGTIPSRYEKFSFLSKIFTKLSMKHIDHLVVVNEDLAKWVTEKFKIGKDRISVISPLLPPIPPPKSIALPDQICKIFEHHNKVICSVGAFIPDYGFDQIINATEELRRELKLDLGLILLENAFTCDEQYKITILKNFDWVSVLTDIPNDHCIQVIKKSAAFLRATRQESFGLSRIEALWNGTPVIATKTGATSGMHLFAFGDKEGLKNQLKHTLFNDADKGDISQRKWQEFYLSQANQNLNALSRIILQ